MENVTVIRHFVWPPVYGQVHTAEANVLWSNSYKLNVLIDIFIYQFSKNMQLMEIILDGIIFVRLWLFVYVVFGLFLNDSSGI